jgi:hypothetical protein
MTKFLIGLAGILVIFAAAFALSSDRRAIRLRVVGAAFGLQAGIAVLVLYVPAGRAATSRRCWLMPMPAPLSCSGRWRPIGWVRVSRCRRCR